MQKQNRQQQTARGRITARPGYGQAHNERRRRKRILAVIGWVLSLMICLSLSACDRLPTVGDIDQSSALALIRFESLDDGVSGVVYRRIHNFDALIGASQVPVLVAFYDRFDPLNTMVIPKLEQMADDYKDRLQIAWIDAEANLQIATAFSVEQLPHFTIVVDAALKRSLIGFDNQGSIRLEQLVQAYLP